MLHPPYNKEGVFDTGKSGWPEHVHCQLHYPPVSCGLFSLSLTSSISFQLLPPVSTLSLKSIDIKGGNKTWLTSAPQLMAKQPSSSLSFPVTQTDSSVLKIRVIGSPGSHPAQEQRYVHILF